MKIVCNTAVLAEACNIVQRGVPQKSTFPAAEGILLQAKNSKLTLTGYDLEVGITTSIECSAESEGSIVLNARLLCDILRRLPAQSVTITSDSHNLCKISSGDAEFSVVGIPADDYPELPTVSGGVPFSIKHNILRDMVKQTIFAVASDDIKPVHKGIKFEVTSNNLRLVSCDSFRLAIRNEAIQYDGEEMTFVVPSKTLSEVVKLVTENDDDDVTLSIGKKFILFEVGNFRIISRLLEGQFFNYNNAIPTDCTTKARVNVKLILDSVDRTSLLISSKIKSPVRCIFDENLIRVSSATSLGSASDKIPAAIDGKRLEIGFNNTYLSDCLKTVDVDEVNISLTSPVSPIVITPIEGDSFLFLIIPMRLKNEAISN
ncbi:MAG: DNA polymerase III subunit beta [Ruminococcaceae bacterium]|nr:DNA polymerase III subunit beta [Oscillospiraceae bacterium]